MAFCREKLGLDPWSKQREILESLRDNPRTAVKSCHGSGKTAVAARAVPWFLSSFRNSRVVTTAPTWAQIKDLLWREIRAGYLAAGGFIGGELFDTRLEMDAGGQWFAVGLSSDRAERFQGHHAEHLLLVIDEASGVSQEVYEAASGFLTAEGARLLLIGNPTQTSGEFFSAFHEAAPFYERISIPAWSTPAFTGERVSEAARRNLVSRQWVDLHGRKWGVGSPLYQVRIAAEFPSESEDVVIGLGDLDAARARELPPGRPLVLACDVARFGGDQTVMVVRRGPVVRLAKAYSGRDLMKTVGEILGLARELHRAHSERPLLVVDDSGLGGGVVDRLRELNEFEVVAYNASKKATSKEDYPRARSEDWFRFSELLPSIDLDPDEELAADLLAPRYYLDSEARRVVELKSETKRRLRRSPDRADACVMAFSIDKTRPIRSYVPRRRIFPARKRAEPTPPVRAGAVAHDDTWAFREGDAEIAASLGVPLHDGRPVVRTPT